MESSTSTAGAAASTPEFIPLPEHVRVLIERLQGENEELRNELKICKRRYETLKFNANDKISHLGGIVKEQKKHIASVEMSSEMHTNSSQLMRLRAEKQEAPARPRPRRSRSEERGALRARSLPLRAPVTLGCAQSVRSVSTSTSPAAHPGAHVPRSNRLAAKFAADEMDGSRSDHSP